MKNTNNIKVKNKLLLLFIAIFIIIIGISTFAILNRGNLLSKIQVEKQNETEELSITYEKKQISDDYTKVGLVVKVSGNMGIEKIIKPDGLEIYPEEGKNEVNMDLLADSNVDYKYTAKGKSGKEIQKIINVTPGDICTIEDLEEINKNLKFNYRLMNDLDFKERSSYRTQERYEYYNQDANNDGKLDNSWLPIGVTSSYGQHAFEGNLNGQNHSIKNLYVTAYGGNSYIGLFTLIKGGTFENLFFENANVIGGGYTFGAGSLAGTADGVTIVRVGATGDIKGRNRVGGITGLTQKSTINECFSECNINCSQAASGVLIGTKNSEKETRITNCYTAGTIYSSSYHNIGGITNAGILSNSFSVSSVTGYNKVPNAGPLLARGIVNEKNECYNSYWAKETSKLPNDISLVKYGTRVEYDDLFKKETYKDWDFDNIWEIKEGETTPYLKCIGLREKNKKTYLDNYINE